MRIQNQATRHPGLIESEPWLYLLTTSENISIGKPVSSYRIKSDRGSFKARSKSDRIGSWQYKGQEWWNSVHSPIRLHSVVQLYLTLHFVLNCCEPWFLTASEEHGLWVFENRVLRIYRPRMLPEHRRICTRGSFIICTLDQILGHAACMWNEQYIQYFCWKP
jgi:hypothetical protein